MRVLILGAKGQLGNLVVQQAPAGIKLSAYTSQICDITDQKNLSGSIKKAAPDVIINCAAYTQVDKAQSEVERAYAVNAQGVENIIKASDASTRIIHISTDFVFDGKATTPYAPSADTNPVGVYGASKLAGERALLELAPEHSVIIRTAWLYAAQGQNFFNTMLRLMRTKDSLSVVSDQFGTPTAAHGLASAIWGFVGKESLTGVYHFSDDGQASWYDFACEIQDQAVTNGLLEKQIPITPIPTSAYPTPAARPAYSVLDKSTTWTALGSTGKPWQETLAEVIHQAQQIKADTV